MKAYLNLKTATLIVYYVVPPNFIYFNP